MRSRLLIMFIALLSTPALAQRAVCVMEFAKSNCWNKYQVTVDFTTTSYPEFVNKIVLVPNVSSQQKQFSCNLGDRLHMKAKYTPPIWDTDQGAYFKQKTNWLVPKKPPKFGGRFYYKICYPNDFELVPIPPGADDKCKCTFKGLRKVRTSITDEAQQQEKPKVETPKGPQDEKLEGPLGDTMPAS